MDDAMAQRNNPHNNNIMLATPGILNRIEEGVELSPVNSRHSPRVSLSLSPAGSHNNNKGVGSADEGEDDLQVCVVCLSVCVSVCVCL